MLEKQRTAFTYQQRPPRPPERKGEQMATRQLPTLRRCAVETASPSDPRTQMGGDGGSSEEKKWNKPQPPKIPAHVFGGWGHLYFAVRVLYFKFQTPHPRSLLALVGSIRPYLVGSPVLPSGIRKPMPAPARKPGPASAPAFRD